MATLFTKTKLYIEANSKTWDDTKVSLQNDGFGDYIKTWNYDGLAKPTDEQIASYETAGNAVEANAGIDATRQTQYLDQKNGTTTFKDHCDKVRSDNPKS